MKLQGTEFVTNNEILDIITMKEIVEKAEHIFTEHVVVEKMVKHTQKLDMK